MAERLAPAPDRFVVRLTDASAPPKAVTELAVEAKPLGGAAPLYVVQLSAASPRDGWAKLSRALGDAGAAYPVLIDIDGAPHYPTGEVTVRFEGKPSANEVAAFAQKHGLRVLRGNELAPQQFVLQPINAEAEFLPDLVARVAAGPGVRSAWANTLSRYSRKS
jgi:hypothetical protein